MNGAEWRVEGVEEGERMGGVGLGLGNLPFSRFTIPKLGK